MTETLYNQLYGIDNLRTAWLYIKSKKSGGGIDSVSVKEFEENAEHNLQELSAQLMAESYVPLPSQKIALQKKDGGTREIGILAVRDKVVQRAVKNLLEPIFEKEFRNISYAYRPQKGTTKAIKRLLHYIYHEHYTWFAVVDIDNCFDAIPVDKLLSFLQLKLKDRKLTRLIELWLRMGKVNVRHRWYDSLDGVPQGGILSPLLANFYLTWLDNFMLKKSNTAYLRYADDLLICGYTKSAVLNKLKATNSYLENKLQLKLNPERQVVHIKGSFTFLGVEINNGAPVLSEEKEKQLRESINKSFGVEEQLPSEKFYETINGIKAYYAQVLTPAHVNKLDFILVGCLKSKLAEAYRLKQIPSKTAIRSFVKALTFFTAENETAKRNIANEIAVFCATIGGNANEPKEKINKSVLKRKRQFQKMESAAMELVVSTPGVVLGKNKYDIVIKKQGRIVNQVNTANLRSLTITSAGVGLSSNLIKFCADKNIGINFLNFDGKPYAMLSTPKFAHAKNQLAQLNAQQSAIGLIWIKAVLKGKMKNQANTLKFFSRQRKETDPNFTQKLPETLAGIKACIQKLKNVKAENANRVQLELMAIEARASRLYWQQVGRILDDYIVFEKREQQGATDPVNSMLNYGYAILYSKVWHAVINARLNPCVGVLHSSENTNAAFVYDMVEEFRAATVDRTVISLITKGEHIEMKDNLLSEQTKHRLLEKLLERFNSIEKFRKTEKRVTAIIHNQMQNSRRYFLGEIPTYKPYIKTW